jgi:hypothetical protein
MAEKSYAARGGSPEGGGSRDYYKDVGRDGAVTLTRKDSGLARNSEQQVADSEKTAGRRFQEEAREDFKAINRMSKGKVIHDVGRSRLPGVSGGADGARRAYRNLSRDKD